MPHEQVNLETFLAEDPEVPAAEPRAPPEPSYLSYPLVKPGAVEARPYQTALARKALRGRTLVVLPTGLGKTIIALLTAATTLHEGKGKVLFLAPTRPLVQQHAETFGALLEVDDQVALGGDIAPAKRAVLFEENRVLFSTPQGLRNDLADGRIDLVDVGLLVVDEAHRTVGDYAYVDIAHRFRNDRPNGLLLGLTASPGSDAGRLDEVMHNLGVETVESRDETSPDVAPYVKDIEVRWVRMPLTPPMLALKSRLDQVVTERAEPLKRARLLPPKPYVSRKDLLEAGGRIRAQLGKGGDRGALFGLLHNQGVVMQALHALELLETQGLEPLRDYLQRMLREPKNKAAKTFINDPRVVDVLSRLVDHEGSSHPKIEALVKILDHELGRKPGQLVIVFAQYRDTIASIVRALGAAGIRAEKFVGQADREGDKGMSQDSQREALERLRAQEFQVLVASSVAEEGLDIPRVDLVVFYEPVPSEIRLIQRRGRTGRHEIGRVAVLIAEDTRDEAFMFAATSREKKMRKMVRGLR